VSEEQGKSPHAIWQPLGAPALIGDPIVQCLILIAVTSAVFLAFPGIDIWFSNLFYANGFVAGQLEAFIGLRDFWRDMTAVIAIVLVAVLVIKLIWPYRQSLLRPRDIVFILSTLVVGPGIITNLVFKDHWGRPRPYMVENYGGDLPFVGAWKITHYCGHNCSFISGEASSSMWLLTLAVLLPPRWRPTGIRVLLAFGAVFSLNRILFGAHFLSDVVLGWWITLLVIAMAYRLFYVSPPAALANDSMEAWLTEAGVGMRQGVGALKERVATALGARRAAKAADVEDSSPKTDSPAEAVRPPDESP
jgi:lipid A 4'-phosphatase